MIIILLSYLQSYLTYNLPVCLVWGMHCLERRKTPTDYTRRSLMSMLAEMLHKMSDTDTESLHVLLCPAINKYMSI